MNSGTKKFSTDSILIVDDIPANIEVLRKTLEMEGYNISFASSGKAALKLIPKSMPDLILLDVMMPEMDGFETCRYLKKNKSVCNIPVIFITAKNEIEDVIKGFQFGGADYITKPFHQEEVYARVQTQLNLRRLAKEKEKLIGELKEHRDHLQEMVDERTKELADANEKLRKIAKAVESSSDAISMTGPLGDHFYQNHAFTELFGYTMEELNSGNGLQKLCSDKDIIDKISNTIQNSNSWIDEINMKTKDGRNIPIMLNVDAIKNSSGEITGLIGIHTDITQHKEMTKALQEAKEKAEQANLLKSEFLANMSHELRTPMHAIMGFVDLGMMYINKWSNEELIENFDEIRESGERLLALLNNLLDLSKLEANTAEFDVQVNDLNEIILKEITSLEKLIEAKKLNVNIEESQIPTVAEFDKTKITQVVVNLLSNAIKFTPDTRNITIKFGKGILSETDKEIPAISMSIIDDGIGVPPDELETVFDKFVQSKKTKTGAGGTGLGLAISKQIIENHHGKIWAENNTDGGAKFTFVIPVNVTMPENALSTRP